MQQVSVNNQGANGRFVRGNNANPKGKKPGYQNFVDRAAFLASRYNLEETIAICKDPKKLGKLSVFDAMIMMRFYEASTSGGHKSMNSILDRLLGKPDQYVRVDQNNTHTVAIQSALKEARELEGDELLRIKNIIEGTATVIENP